jgi:hypothetical protein
MRCDEIFGHGIKYVDRVHRLPRAFDMANVIEGLFDRIGRWHADELGRHDRTRAIRWIGQKPLDGKPCIGIQTLQQFRTMRFVHLPAKVCNPVGGDSSQQIGCGAARQKRDDPGTLFQPRLVEDLHGTVPRQAKQATNPAASLTSGEPGATLVSTSFTTQLLSPPGASDQTRIQRVHEPKK